MKKQYKALILDLDGTTVKMGFENFASVRVKKAIANLSKRIPVCVATGRSFNDAFPVIKDLGISSLCTFNDGAVIYDMKKGKTIETYLLDRARVSNILEVLSKHHCRVYVNAENITEFEYAGQAFDANVAAFYCTQMTLKKARAVQKNLQHIPGLEATLMSQTFDGKPVLKIGDAHATKQQALTHIFKYLHIKPEEVVAVGDSENDLPMIIAAGMGVAMGNAAEGLKSVADYIAPSVDEDGVAHVIEKFFS